jgi:hypothetical protein
MKDEIAGDTGQSEEQKPVDEESGKKPPRAEKAGGKIESAYALPASSPEVLAKILKAYVIASKQGAEAVKYTDVAAVAAIHPTLVSRNNAFLCEAGFILAERWGHFKPSPETTDYAKQAPWDEETAKGHIRSLIDRTWFGLTVQQQFQLQDTLTRTQLITAFGIKATPDTSDSNRLGLLLDFLMHFEYLLTDEKGNYIWRPRTEPIPVGASTRSEANITEEARDQEARGQLEQPAEQRRGAHSISQININLNLTSSTTDEELELLVKKAKAALNLLLDRI